MAVLVYISEQPTYRPRDVGAQEKHYPGKAKRRAMKIQYTTTHDGTIFQTSTAAE